ncbi:MAG TPA: Mur ligase family protein [Pyrinomonadaceae bacterium]|jgi:UDP-N-acetylmuramyl tripeptide synthase
MKIKRIRVLSNANFYSHRPVILMRLEIENSDRNNLSESSDLTARFKDITAAKTCERKMRDFRAAQDELAAVVKNVALGLMSLAGLGGPGGVVRFSGDPGIYEIAVEYQSEEVAVFLLEIAVEAVAAALRNESYDVAAKIAEARTLAARGDLRADLRQIVEAAERRGIPWFVDEEDAFVKLGYGKNSSRIRAGNDPNSFEVASGSPSKVRVFPAAGSSPRFGDELVELLYTEGRDARIPIVAVTGTNGKTTVTRLISHVLLKADLNVGTATTNGILFNGETVAEGDTTGPASARRVLEDERVDVAVLETARGGILRRGLGWDWADVAVVTNITEDHIGQDGIESLADLVSVKALIAERVRENGTLVLNADDAESAGLINRPAVSRVEKKIAYFAMSEENPIVKERAGTGETVYFVRGDWICERRGEALTRIAETTKISTTVNGTADFQVQNAMAATAVCRALGLSPERIADGLYGFQNAVHNPGRNNLYRVGEGYVLVDYGHNTDGFAAVSRMARRWTGKTVTAIIGLPGDRDNRVIEEAAQVAARGFNRVIVTEEVNLRGRAPGEMAKLLCEAIAREKPGGDCEIVPDEIEAFSKAIREMRKNEVVVMFYRQLNLILEILAANGAVPVSSFEETVAAN